MTVPSSKSMVLQEPNLAQCPGESAPISRGFPLASTLVTQSLCCLSHTLATAGNRRGALWFEKVLWVIVATPMHLRTRRTLEGREEDAGRQSNVPSRNGSYMWLTAPQPGEPTKLTLSSNLHHGTNSLMNSWGGESLTSSAYVKKFHQHTLRHYVLRLL